MIRFVITTMLLTLHTHKHANAQAQKPKAALKLAINIKPFTVQTTTVTTHQQSDPCFNEYYNLISLDPLNSV